MKRVARASVQPDRLSDARRPLPCGRQATDMVVLIGYGGLAAAQAAMGHADGQWGRGLVGACGDDGDRCDASCTRSSSRHPPGRIGRGRGSLWPFGLGEQPGGPPSTAPHTITMKGKLMAYTPTNRRNSPSEPMSEGDGPVADEYASSVSPPNYPGGEHPRLIEDVTSSAPTAKTRSKRPTSADAAGITSGPSPAAASISSALTTPGG